jgi:hypothetical protein
MGKTAAWVAEPEADYTGGLAFFTVSALAVMGYYPLGSNAL